MTPTNPFFENENFHLNLEQYIEYHDLEEDDVKGYEDTYSFKVEDCTLEQSITIDEGDIQGMIIQLCDSYEDRQPEDSDTFLPNLTKAFKESLDLTKFNELCPKLWYPNGNFITITKQDLLDQF